MERIEAYSHVLAPEAHCAERQASATLRLLADGCTVPFISRYRKEATGGLDEVVVETLRQGLARLQTLDERRDTILQQIEALGALTTDLRARIEATWDPTLLEDLYAPYKPRRKTRAMRARELGLAPLAEALLAGRSCDATRYITADVPDEEAAWQGARDIVAEWVSDQAEAREMVRTVYRRQAEVTTRVVKGQEQQAAKYADYFARTEPLRTCPSHRVLALLRGEREGALRVTVAPPDTAPLTERLGRRYAIHPATATQVRLATDDAYKRLLAPAMATWALNEAKQRADREAVSVFEANLRQLLLAAPLGHVAVLAIDPGIRTGCKVVCLDQHGALRHHTVVFPQRQPEQARRTLAHLITKYEIAAVAIGDGTAGRETEAFVRAMPESAPLRLFLVSEDGASIYSASAAAREEFPDEDVTVRGAVSIGRRLMDPLAELVKIDPQSLGVGQYQHDVDATLLRTALDGVVESCVNRVGVDVNTASRQLLLHVSGLGPQTAANIVAYRSEHGPFGDRRELLRVPRLGPKTYQQCAGFLRIPGADNPLDASAVHPESYHLVERMARDQGCGVSDLMADAARRDALCLADYVNADVGLPTLTDIVRELAQPGRDPRESLEEFAFDPSVHSLEDLRVGQRLPGIVTNITAFGAFVDVGVKTDGLVHISQVADHFVRDVASVLKLRQHVMARVIDIDAGRGRISLSLKNE